MTYTCTREEKKHTRFKKNTKLCAIQVIKNAFGGKSRETQVCEHDLNYNFTV